MYSFKSITELDNYINQVASEDGILSNFSVEGEISGFKRYPSGHCYFTLKDADSQISAVMFRYSAECLSFEPKDGLKVISYGKAGLYNSNGKFQFYVKSMKLVGKGDLHEQFNELFEKLNKEGLFDPSHKKKIPVLPRKIGVITSPQGAVIHDIITTLNIRNPHFDLTVFPAAVQGEACPVDFCRGIDYFSKNTDVDVVILARGGGSYEELFGFNDEALARKIYACRIPVISAIGHEVDKHISDYVADLSVATPTAAAEQVIGGLDDLTNFLTNKGLSLDAAMENFIHSRKTYLMTLSNHKALSAPSFYVDKQTERVRSCEKALSIIGTHMLTSNLSTLNNDNERLQNALNSKISQKTFELKLFTEKLDSLGPLNVLKRGFSYITDENSGKTFKSASELKTGTEVKLVLSDGTRNAIIK